MKIDQLQLPAGDLAAHRDFYESVLGLPVLSEAPGKLVLQAGASRLTFEQAPPGGGGVYHFAFNIPEDRFGEAKQWVSHRVALIKNNAGEDEFNFTHWNAHSLYFYDPAGNILEFIARHDLAGGSTRTPFGGQSLLSISEVGLATEDVAATVHSMQDQLGVGIYDGAGSDTFTAVGDVHGLFIVVKQGRIWFPDTGKQAELLPVTVQVTPDTGEHYILSGPPYQPYALGMLGL